jgi:hypothetical protein
LNKTLLVNTFSKQENIRPQGGSGKYRSTLRGAPFGHIFVVSFPLQYAYTASVCFFKAMPKPSQLRKL